MSEQVPAESIIFYEEAATNRFIFVEQESITAIQYVSYFSYWAE